VHEVARYCNSRSDDNGGLVGDGDHEDGMLVEIEIEGLGLGMGQ